MSEASPRRLTDPEETLLRQVHPSHLDTEGRPLRLAFAPFPRDDGMLSTLRERVGAKRAYDGWQQSGHDSAGTWGVSVGEATDAELPCYADGNPPTVPEDHASIDFNDHTKPERKARSRLIWEAALSRGCLHP